MFFGKLDIVAALLGQLVIVSDALDGAFPAGQLFEDGLASLKLGGGREI